MSSKHFSDWLEKEIDMRGWSMSELARRCDVSRPAISRVVSGERGAGPELCRAIAHAFDMPEEKIFRIAGLLSELPAPEEDFTFAQVYDMMKHLTPEERFEIMEYVQWRYRRRIRESEGE
jgi:transcriptional regulator with XRE-family HTH domain